LFVMLWITFINHIWIKFTLDTNWIWSIFIFTTSINCNSAKLINLHLEIGLDLEDLVIENGWNDEKESCRISKLHSTRSGNPRRLYDLYFTDNLLIA
jgi:hypothetical protein